MGTIKKNTGLLLGLVVMLGLVSSHLVSAIPGTATFYTQSPVPSACFVTGVGQLLAAASDAIWANRAACGRRYRVTCTGPPQLCRPGTSVIVTIVDYCPSPCPATLDLSQQAFNMIANPTAGKINIDYTPNGLKW